MRQSTVTSGRILFTLGSTVDTPDMRQFTKTSGRNSHFFFVKILEHFAMVGSTVDTCCVISGLISHNFCVEVDGVDANG